MADIKRINLSFDLDRIEDLKAYNVLKAKRNKTAYAVEIILENIDKNSIYQEREIFKQLIKESISELNLTTSPKVGNIKNEDDIPNDIFDIISNI